MDLVITEIIDPKLKKNIFMASFFITENNSIPGVLK